MVKHIVALVFIFICTTFAWVLLAANTEIRTHSRDSFLENKVGQLWGVAQTQLAPTAYSITKKVVVDKKKQGTKIVEEKVTKTIEKELKLDGSNIDVDFNLDYRQKGLLWYSTYTVSFKAVYALKNDSKESRDIVFNYSFPTVDGVYDNFDIKVDGKSIENLLPEDGVISHTMNFKPNEVKKLDVCYKTQGLDSWDYKFSDNVDQIKNFEMNMKTNFNQIDFKDNSISPTKKTKEDNGWLLTWQYDNLISGKPISMVMPKKLNPGPFVSKITFFAPVSLFLFMFLVFIISTIKKIKIHPMNYFFVAASFFSFHLLMAYLADLIDIHLAFLISSVVSVFLVISYMRLVVGLKYAFIEIGLSQIIYLVLFSYAFFLEGYTGLAITILCIITLFVVMQTTGKIDWEEVFRKPPEKDVTIDDIHSS